MANTHLSFVPGWNRVQLRRLTRDLRGFPGPRVLMGDLSSAPTLSISDHRPLIIDVSRQ